MAFEYEVDGGGDGGDGDVDHPHLAIFVDYLHPYLSPKKHDKTNYYCY